MPFTYIRNDSSAGGPGPVSTYSNGDIIPQRATYASPALASRSRSINGTVRNNTETGDFGQLPPFPMSKPLSSFKGELDGRSSITVESSQADNKLTPSGENGQSIHASSQDAKSLSNPHTQLVNSRIRREPQEPPEHHSIEDFQAWSVSHSSPKSHASGHRHPSQITSYQTRLIDPTGRPRSPFAYPTRLRRPGYRPSSPALSEVYQHGYGSRSSSRPNSPASTRSMHHVPLAWKQHPNHSDPMLKHYASVRPTRDFEQHGLALSSSQASGSYSNQNGQSLVATTILQSQRSLSNLRHQAESPPASPGFYDYSEDFEGPKQPESINQSVSNWKNTSILSNGAHTRIEPHPSDSVKSVVDNSYRTPEQVKAGFQEFLAPLEKPGVLTMRLSAPERKNGSTAHENELYARLESHESSGVTTSLIDDKQSSLLGTRSYQDVEVSARNDQTEDLERREFIAGSAKDRPSSAASKCTSEPNGHANASNETLSERFGTPLTSKPKVTAYDTRVEGGIISTDESSTLPHGYSGSEHTEIISPTPERSINSPSTLHRFSRILGLQDSNNASKDGDGWEISPMEGRTRAEVQRHVSHADNTNIQLSTLTDIDWDETDELSPSLMRTFGPRAEDSPQSKNNRTNTRENPQNRNDNTHDRIQPIHSNEPVDSSEGEFQPVSEAERGQKTACFAPAKGRLELPGLTTELSAPHSHVNTYLPSMLHHHDQIAASKSSLCTQHYTVSIDPSRAATEPAHDIFVTGPLFTSITHPRPIVEANKVDAPLVNAEKRPQDRESLASSHGSRPWNRDSTYPWMDQTLNLDMTLPDKSKRTPSPSARFPLFKLRIQRASTSTNGTGRLTKRRVSSDDTASSKRTSGHFLPQNSICRPKAKSKFSIGPSQENSSHDISHQALQSRFVESFDSPPQVLTEIPHPNITLLSPSSGQEAQSFFSDDSSQAVQRGSLRKRISHFRSRHSQTNLAHAGGRSPIARRQSQDTVGANSQTSRLKNVGAMVFRKARFWWHRSGKKVFGLSSKARDSQCEIGESKQT